MTNKANPEPNYAVLRARFAAEAKLQADTILANLFPEATLQPEKVKLVQLAMWRTAVSIVGLIHIEVPASNCRVAVAEWRDLVIHANNELNEKAHQVEKAIAADYVGDDHCAGCGGTGIGLFPMEDGKPICRRCGMGE
jgi:hypothetical protein